MLKRHSIRFAVALLGELAGVCAGPTVALAAAPQHRDQVPGFYRLQVGDLEVTALFDASATVHLDWLKGTKDTMDGVAAALHQNPHLLDTVDSAFVVNTGRHLILIDAGEGTWWGPPGHVAESLRSAGYTPEQVDLVLLTHLHADHIGGLTTHDGNRVYPNATVYVAKAESDFWLSPDFAAKAPKDVQPFFQSAQAIAAPYVKAGNWHTFSGSGPIVDGMHIVPLHGHTPGHTGYEFSSKGHTILFWGDIIHAQSVQLRHPEITAVFDIDPTAAAATRNQLLAKLASEDVLIAGPHLKFPALGRLRKEGSSYTWEPVAYTDQWNDTAPSPNGISITVFTSPDDQFWTNSVIIEGAHEVTLVDAQLTKTNAERVLQDIQETQKPLSLIYITHAHADHFLGLEVFKEAYPSVRIIAPPAVVDRINQVYQEKIDKWKQLLGAGAASHPVVISTFDGTAINVDGSEIEILNHIQGDTAENTMLWIPGPRTLIAGDVVFSHMHLYTADTNRQARDRWLTSLQRIRELRPAVVIPGHSKVGAALDATTAIEFTEHYLLVFEEELAHAKDQESLINAMKDRFPSADFVLALERGAKAHVKS